MSKFRFQILSAGALLALASLTACSDSEPQTRIEVLHRMHDVLAEVKDTAAADAAAGQHAALAAKIEQLPEISKEESERVKSAVGSWLGQIQRLEKEKFYDSEALKNELRIVR